MQALSFKITIAVFLLVLIYSLSCTKKVEVALPPYNNRLVVHSYTAVGDSFMVKVGQTVRNNNNGTLNYLSNAQVLLYVDGVLKDTLEYADLPKVYASHVHAEDGRSYTLKVSVPGFQPVEATATPIKLTPTESFQYSAKARHDVNRNDLDDIKFGFRDPSNEKNYYLVAVFRSAVFNQAVGCVYTTDPVIEQPRGSLLPFDEGDCIEGDKIFFTDKAFDGQLKELTLSVVSFELMVPTPGNPGGPINRPYMKRYAISEDFYKYYKYTSSLHIGDDLPLFTEPVPEKGNITNGFGMFTVYNVITDTLR